MYLSKRRAGTKAGERIKIRKCPGRRRKIRGARDTGSRVVGGPAGIADVVAVVKHILRLYVSRRYRGFEYYNALGTK